MPGKDHNFIQLCVSVRVYVIKLKIYVCTCKKYMYTMYAHVKIYVYCAHGRYTHFSYI